MIDSITPGWRQIGAVWLPLPHLLNLLPVQVDLLYRTGASGTISILSMGLAAVRVRRDSAACDRLACWRSAVRDAARRSTRTSCACNRRR